MVKQKHMLPILALISAEVLWGINTPNIKIGLRTVPLALYLAVALWGAALLALPKAIRTWKRLSLRSYVILIVGSVFAIAIGNVLLLMGLKLVPSVNAPLIGLLQPILFVLLGVLFLKEKFRRRTFMGILVAFGGAAIAVSQPWRWAGSGHDLFIGNVYLLLATVCSAVGVAACKPALKEVGASQVTFLHLAIGTLPVAIYAIRDIPSLTVAGIGRSGFLAMGYNIVSVGLANLLFMYGLKQRRLQEAGIFSYLHPVVTSLAGWMILSEVPNVKIALGGLLIAVGIYISEKQPEKHVLAIR